MMLTTDETLLFSSAVNNDILVYFFVIGVDCQINKLTKSTKGFCISVRLPYTIKLNIKEAFMRNDGFLQRLMW